MKLTVLGGSAAGVNTGQGNAGYYVEAGNTRLVLDLGPGTVPELRRFTDFRTLDAIVISHLHLDHVLDLGALRFALAYNPISPAGRIPLWVPPGGRAFLRRFGDVFADPGQENTFFSSVFDIEEFDPTQPLTIGDATLIFQPTVHYVPGWAVRVATGNEPPLVYTADTGPAANLAAFASGAGLLVAESTLLEPSSEPYQQRGHMTAAEAAELARDAHAARLLLTHMWEERGFDRYAAEAARVFSGPIFLANPGLTIAW